LVFYIQPPSTFVFAPFRAKLGATTADRITIVAAALGVLGITVARGVRPALARVADRSAWSAPRRRGHSGRAL
jgi:hypothetical protein